MILIHGQIASNIILSSAITFRFFRVGRIVLEMDCPSLAVAFNSNKIAKYSTCRTKMQNNLHSPTIGPKQETQAYGKDIVK